MSDILTQSEFEKLKNKYRPWARDNRSGLTFRLIATLNHILNGGELRREEKNGRI